MEFCRENDVALTHSFADAPKDMRIPRERFENLRLTEQRSDGIVVHGGEVGGHAGAVRR